MKALAPLAATMLLLGSFNLAFADKSAGETVDDTWLHTKVKTALVGFGTSGINIEVYHGVVQLGGFIDSEVKEKAALDQAASVKGVVAVSDQLYIAEPGRTAGRTLDDGVLEGRVSSALSDADSGASWDINVEVNRGTVLLSGFVDDEEIRGRAITIAEDVDGVVEVINGMDIKT